MADAFEPRFADLVRIFTTTQGTDHFIVGAAVTGFRSFHSAIEIGDQFYYCAQHSDRPSEHEIGRGTLRADGKIARDPVGGNFTIFSPGAKTVALVAPSEWHTATQQRLDETADCVGVIVAAFGLPVDAVRRNYRIRGPHRREIEAELATYFRKIARTRSRPGDVLLMAIAPDQIHLAVRTGRGFVHADAGLRKVVETPGTPPWPVVGVWRRRVRGPNGERSWRL